MKKTIVFLMIVLVAFATNLSAGNFFLAKLSHEGSLIVAWDHMEKSWLTEVVISADGDLFMLGIGPMFKVGNIEFNAPFSITLEKKSISDELSLAPRTDVTLGKLLIQNWNNIVFSSKYFVSWSTDNRVLYQLAPDHKLGLNFLTSVGGGESYSMGILHQYKITEAFTVASFAGYNITDEEAKAWLKLKFFIP